MKKLYTLLFIFSFSHVYSQCYDDYYCLPFEDTTCQYHVIIDTTAFPDNVWRTGDALKPVLDPTACHSKVIITDLVNPYPVNNHSVFIIRNIATPADVYGFRTLAGDYYVQTDSLNDYGSIEISLDRGINWIDLHDPAFSSYFLWWT